MAFKKMIGRVKEAYPHVSVFCDNLTGGCERQRTYVGARLCYMTITGKLSNRARSPCSTASAAGDGFVGGLLYAILRGWEPVKWPQFGWATGALAATLEADYAQPVSEDQVWSIFQGNARVINGNAEGEGVCKKSDIGIIGLAVMGENLVLNMESKGFSVSVYNRTTEKVTKFIEGGAKGKKHTGGIFVGGIRFPS